MLAAALGTAAAAREVDRPAAAMTVPLTLWLGFATLLSEELWAPELGTGRYGVG